MHQGLARTLGASTTRNLAGAPSIAAAADAAHKRRSVSARPPKAPRTPADPAALPAAPDDDDGSVAVSSGRGVTAAAHTAVPEKGGDLGGVSRSEPPTADVKMLASAAARRIQWHWRVFRGRQWQADAADVSTAGILSMPRLPDGVENANDGARQESLHLHLRKSDSAAVAGAAGIGGNRRGRTPRAPVWQEDETDGDAELGIRNGKTLRGDEAQVPGRVRSQDHEDVKQPVAVTVAVTFGQEPEDTAAVRAAAAAAAAAAVHARPRQAREVASADKAAGAQFTCFTGTKVQILTQRMQRSFSARLKHTCNGS